MEPRRKLKRIPREAAIYFAGLFDGEGCVNICERAPKHGGPGQVTPTFRCELSVSNSHHGVMLHVQQAIGGNLFKCVKNVPKKNGQPRRIIWRWGACQKESAHILSYILPFLIVKRDQALLARQYYDWISKFQHQPHPGKIGKTRLSPEEIECRRQFVRKMQALNHPA